MADEPSLPPLPAVSWNSQSQTISISRKRAYDGAAGSHSIATSSDPAVFSSDDDPNVDNYAPGNSRRGKRRYVGPWYHQRRVSTDSTLSTRLPIRKSKRTFERQQDSGVWIGSDGTTDNEDAILELIQPGPSRLPISTPSKPQDGASTISSEERVAQDKIRKCLEDGNEYVDLSALGLEVVSNTTISPLSSFVCIPKVQRDVPFGVRSPQLHLFLSNNCLETVPKAVFDLVELNTLSLRGNRLTELPPAISQASNLRDLSLSQNSLQYLPAELLDLMCGQQNLVNLTLHPNPFVRPEHLPPRPESPEPEKKQNNGRGTILYKESFPAEGRCLTFWVDSDEVAPRMVDSLVGADGLPHTSFTAYQSYVVARSPIQFSDARGIVHSKFRLSDYTDISFSTQHQIPTEDLSVTPNPPSARGGYSSVLSDLEPKDRIPSLFELALKSCYKSSWLEQLPEYLPEDVAPQIPQVLRQLHARREAGDMKCCICSRPMVIPLTEWVEWWDISLFTYTRPRQVSRRYLSDGDEERAVPFLFRGCSWQCLPKPRTANTWYESTLHHGWMDDSDDVE